MLQTEKMTTNSANPSAAAINQIKIQTDKQADIVKRLEELNKWQEEQKKLLEARQTMQRQMLGMEQQTMYEMLGLQSASETTLVEVLQGEGREESLSGKGREDLEEYEEESTEESLETSQLDEEEGGEEQQQKNIDPASYKTLTSGYETELCADMQQQKPKKPFLKRGAGLKQRFKIDPDELRLNNLPKYKYANAHPRLRLKPPGKFNNTKKTMPTTKINNTDNAALTNSKSANTATALDAHEQRFQNLLISSKNTCSSTPDTKSSFNSNKKLAGAKTNILTTAAKEKSSLPQKVLDCSPNERCKLQPAVTPMVAWSKILDPLEIEPLQVPRSRVQSLPETEESIFELLEQKAKNGSFDMDSTCLKQFMQRRITDKLNETDDNLPIQQELRNKRLEPLVGANKAEELLSSSSDEAEEEEAQQTDDIEESTESDDTTHKTIETTNSYQTAPTSKVRVRFSDSNETHEYEEETESTFNDTSRLSAGSAQQEGQGDSSNNELFQQFKDALFAALQIKADQYLANDSTITTVSDTTLTPKESLSLNSNNYNNNSIYSSPACQELQEKTNMIKIRLEELEKEIQNFKNNNVLLMKAKQEHELEKSLHAQEHLEAMERLKDEKIQMEIYLHDERVKLEDEKRQFEQNMKMKSQGLIAKERKECERLREQVSQLEAQLKAKESNHTSAQARLRTQIRNLEREQSKLHEQMENLMRENKRLESENLKISREQNNKILLEINRNIAKLAPKQIQHSSTSMPEEGPPTLSASRTVSKCIVAAATANKNSAKAYKNTSTKFSNAKLTTNKKSSPLNAEDQNTSTATFSDEKSLQQHANYMINPDEDDEEDEDILKEFQMTPAKVNNMRTNISPPRSTSKQQKLEPSPPPPPSSPRISGDHNNNMKREIVNADGSKDIWYPNGNLKKISADGMIIRMLYYNKDIKETNINEGTVKYYYAETNTWHTTYLDGLEILEFPNGQVEHRHKNGIVEVHYPNNSVKIMNPKDEHKQEEWRFADGTHLVQMRNGDKILSLPNGQKEIHNKLHKRREYPDGTVKIVYPDGSTETRYSNGRVRLKDKEGKLVMDTEMAK